MSGLCLSVNQSEAGIESPGNWRSSSDITLPSKNGPIQAIVRRLSFTWRRSTDQFLEHHDVIAVVVPSKNLYWLGESSDQQMYENRTVDRNFFVLAGNIVGVSSNRGDVLKFYVSSSQLTTANASQELDAILHQKLNKFGSQKWDIEPIPFAMQKVLGFFPFTGLGSAQGEAAANVTKIDVTSGNFTIELDGGKDDAVTATISFDSAFQPVKATLRGKQVFPK